MNIPQFVYAMMQQPDGNMNPSWMLWFNQLIDQMNQNLSDEGYVIPSLSTANIALLTDSVDGTLVYDTDNTYLMVCIAGVFVPLSTGTPVITLPLVIAQGGTGAITAPAALVNLGALPIAGGTMTGDLILGPGATINNLTITTPATGSTLSIADTKTLAVSNTLTLAGVDGTTITFQASDIYVGRSTTDTLVNKSMDGNFNTFTNIPGSAFTTSYLKTDGTTPLTGNWAAGTFSATFDSVIIGSGANTISGLSIIINSGTLTLPTTTDVLVGRATTDSFTNKTFDTAATGNIFQINGTGITAVTGSGSVALSTSPTFVTPTLGAALATSINGLTITSSTGTLTIATGKVLTLSNTLTFAGTDTSLISFGAGGTVTYTSNNLSVFASTTSAQLAGVISDETGSGSLVFATSPTLVTPILGACTATTFNGLTITTTTGVFTLTNAKTLAVTNSLTLSGTDSTIITFQATDTYVGRSTTDTLINKSMDGNSNTFTNIPGSAFSSSYVKADGTTPLTGNWSAGAFSATFNSVIVGSAANRISGLATIINGSGAITLNTSGTVTLPNATDTLVGKATTDTFTNKTYDTAGSGNVFKINGTGISAISGSGAVVLVTSATLITPILGVASATSLTVTGTGGSGYLELQTQSAAPVLSATNSLRMYSNSLGMLAWTQQNDLMIRNISSTLTAHRTYTLPDASGTFTLLGNTSTGSGDVVLATSPTLITPVLGVATATSINKVAITAPATSATLTIANGKTLTVNNTVAFTGTDSSTLTFGAGGTITYTSNNLSVFSATTSAQLRGVMSDETGTGALVFANGAIGDATATSLEMNGTGGGGYIQLNTQSATPTITTSNCSQIFTDGSGRFCFTAQSDGFVRRFAGALTSNRILTIPDAAGTFTLLGNSSTGTGSVVLDTGATITSATFVTPTFGALSFTSATINGTGGNGFVQLNTQSATPTISTSNCSQIFTDSSGRFAFTAQSDGFVRRFGGALTANRTYTYPDVAGTFTLLGNTTTGTGSTIVLDTNAALTTPTATSMNMVGINGAGFLQLNTQTSGNPSAGNTNSVRLFASSGGILAWIQQNDGFTRFIGGTFTANRTITFQDKTGTVYVTGGTNVAIADGGTGAGTAAAARTNLGINLDSARNYSDQTALGFGTNRTPSTTNDTLVVVVVQITETNGNSGTCTAVIDSTTTIAKVQLNHATVAAGSIIIEGTMTFICPANSAYKITTAGGGTRSLDSIYELTL